LTPRTQDNIPDYASVAAFELWKDPAGALSVELRFRNGSTTTTDGSDLLPLQINGEASVPLAQFKSGLAPYLVTNLGEWCNLCENTETRGCDLIELVNATTESASVTSTVGRHRTSPVVSGVIGALVGLVLAAIAFAVLEGVRSRRDRSRSARRGPADGDSVRPTCIASLLEASSCADLSVLCRLAPDIRAQRRAVARLKV
jgi:hypothetical protein